MSSILLKNISGGKVNWKGFLLEDQEVIDLYETNIFDSTNDMRYIINMIESGNAELDVGNGVVYCVANGNDSAAKRLFNNIIQVKIDNEVVIPRLETLNFVGNTQVEITSGGDVNVDIIPNELSVVTFQLPFVRNGSIGDAWLNCYETGMPSNETPALVPWKSKLIGLTFTNKKQSSDSIIEFYVVPEGDGCEPYTKLFDWTLLNTRVARKTNFVTDVIFEAGDKVALFLNKEGNKPDDVVVTMYLKSMSDASNEDYIEDFSGNISFNNSTGSR